jgi:hypothetical protein
MVPPALVTPSTPSLPLEFLVPVAWQRCALLSSEIPLKRYGSASKYLSTRYGGVTWRPAAPTRLVGQRLGIML